MEIQSGANSLIGINSSTFQSIQPYSFFGRGIIRKILATESKHSFRASIVPVGVLAIVTSIGFAIYLLYKQYSKNQNLEKPLQEQKSEILLKENLYPTIQQSLKALRSDFTEFLAYLKSIPSDFFSEKDQNRAKQIFTNIMKDVLNAEVYFPKAYQVNDPENLTGKLNRAVFKLGFTAGTEQDIVRFSSDSDKSHLFQIASQYNGAESPKSDVTPSIGEAMIQSAHDDSQGPLAQRTNPFAFELVTAFLSNLGFNILNEVLPSAGKIFAKKHTQNEFIANGYLRVVDAGIGTLTNEFKTNYFKAEYVCYSSLPYDGGSDPVYLVLQSAPYKGAPPNAAHDWDRLSENTDTLEKYAALANYTAMFQQGISLAKEKGKPVVIHLTAVGGFSFGNLPENIQWGFEKAALALQEEMAKPLPGQISPSVTVMLDAYHGGGCLKDWAEDLELID